MIEGRAAEAGDACPHGKTLGTCPEAWCRARVEDLERFPAKPLMAPETADEIPSAAERKSSTSWREHVAALEGVSVVFDKPSVWPPGAHGCPRCNKWWTGTRSGHCMTCHETFGSDTAFDTHRHGAFNPVGRRRCRPVLWMQDKGWHQDEQGIWRLPRPETNPFEKGQ